MFDIPDLAPDTMYKLTFPDGTRTHNLHDLVVHLSWVGSVPPWQILHNPLTTGGEELEDLDHGLSDVSTR